jgi:5-(carboxyamino)imidazole ribonucleotide synthase
MIRPLPPGSTVGILGGGQLGRMLALAAAELGFDAHIFTPETESPAARVAAAATVAPYTDLRAVAAFAAACDVVTYEFENVPLETAREAAAHAPLRPSLVALEVAQDRLAEKTAARDLGIETVAFADVASPADLAAAIARIGAPAILKSRRLGYDGKGQVRIAPADLERPGWAEAAHAAAGGGPSILEAFAPFTRELSVIAARGLDGGHAAYPLAENRHGGGVLRESRAPAAAAPETAARAHEIANLLLDASGYVGVIAVELFELEDGRLLFNEFAPRVHNSGHWTPDACVCGQFEMHIRAVAGWPLGDPTQRAPATMTNLFGKEALAAPALAGERGVRVHVYGKRDLVAGRKTGHVTRLGPTSE